MTLPAAPNPTVLRFNVLGIGVSALSLAQAVELVLAARPGARLGYVCVSGVHGITEAQRDPRFRRILQEAWLNVPDGMPLVWLGHREHRHVTRVYGPDLMLAVCDAGRAIGLTHYFYGGQEGVAELLREKLTARFPGLQVVGTYTPPFRPLTPAEKSALAADLAQKKPSVVWVGLSTPRQEYFMAENWATLDAGVLIGVGAAFDFHSGRIRQAPRWMQRNGLEWLYRLLREPRRLGRRYLVNNPLFVGRVALQLTGLRKYPLVLPPSAG